MGTLIDLRSKVNVIYSVYTTKLGIYAREIDISIQKIDKSYLNTFEIVIPDCLVKNKLRKVGFF